ncbi:MAG: ATP-binding protein [Paludibacteraceae bacterium]|nr:ATP-binding protein [Paludibacteraceae bacterium]
MEKREKQLPAGFQFLKTKVLAGYLLIVLVAVVSVFFVINNLRSFSIFDTSRQVTKEKMYSLNSTFFNLYEAECLIGEALITPSKFKEYATLSDSITKQISEMKELFEEEEQLALLDSLTVLLSQKRRNVQNLVFLAANSTIDELYRKQLLKAIEENDSLLTNRIVEQTVTVVSDTFTYKRPSSKKRSFFRRIFSSSEPEDTMVEVRKREYSVTDSLLSSYNPADTINRIFESLKSQVREQKVILDRTIMSRMMEIQRMNKSINTKMNVIIHELQEEDWNNAVNSVDEREASLDKLMVYLRYFVGFAMVLLFVLIMMVWRDVNRSKRYSRQLERANQQTLKLMDNREKLMLSVAHDIKAPLSSIIGYIELLDDNKLNVKQSYYLGNMKTSSEHILRLVTDILDFNRLDAGVVELNPLPFNSRSLFEGVANTFRPQAEKKNLQLNFNYTSDTEQEMLLGDPLRIRQIVDNLVSNAVKFTQKGGVTLYVSLAKKEDATCALQIVVADTGVGISEENQKVIFNEYVRIESDEVAVEGFGLGLSIMKKLVDIHNGSLAVESEEGKGSTFTIVLPLAYSNEMQVVKPKEPEKKIELRVLVIDDDPSQLTMVSELLKSRGITCTACVDPYAALDVIEKNTFDIILSDIQMPGFNGFEIVKRVRNGNFPNAKTIPVIALSARADISLSKFKKHGFTSFLNKPFTGDKLVSEIVKYTGIKEDFPMRSQKETDQSAPLQGFASILSYAGGDVNAEYEILSSFLVETKKNVVELARLHKEGDAHAVGRLAHKMLAIFKLLGDNTLVTWLTELELEKPEVMADTQRFEANGKKIAEIVLQGDAELERIKKNVK